MHLLPLSARATSLLLLLVTCFLSLEVESYSTRKSFVRTRRNIISQIGAAVPLLTGVSIPNSAAYAKEVATSTQDAAIINDATDALTSLIENWERATVDCTYADVPRELLEAKNKEKLLEKASEFALFDKSTSVVSCKRTNRVVRDYIGVTGKGPLVNLEKKLLKKSLVEQVDPDNLDSYFSAVEVFAQEMAKANSLSYTAGTADFDSVNNFEKGNESTEGDSNLEQARRAIEEANKALKMVSSLITVS